LIGEKTKKKKTIRKEKRKWLRKGDRSNKQNDRNLQNRRREETVKEVIRGRSKQETKRGAALHRLRTTNIEDDYSLREKTQKEDA